MPKLSLRQAATAANISKSTILRAVQSGRLSADRTQTGGYAIDPAELFRVYPAPVRTASMGQDAPVPEVHEPVMVHMIQAQLAAALTDLAAERRFNADRLAELRLDRDRWHAQAERLSLAPPAVARSGLLSRLFGLKAV